MKSREYYLNWVQAMFVGPYPLHCNYMHPFYRIKRSQACIYSIVPERELSEQDFQFLTYNETPLTGRRHERHTCRQREQERERERERETHTHLFKILS
jgi:hypothetical protein